MMKKADAPLWHTTGPRIPPYQRPKPEAAPFTCPSCGGRGTVLDEGGVFTCPECLGSGRNVRVEEERVNAELLTTASDEKTPEEIAAEEVLDEQLNAPVERPWWMTEQETGDEHD